MVTSEKLEAIKVFGEGRKFYKLMSFKEALEKFEKALGICPDDGPSKVYIDRCKEYIINPPPKDWDGVYIMKTK